MKILIVSARYYPEPFSITRIAEGLVKLGNDVTVLTGKPNYGKWKIYDGYENVKEENIGGVRVVRVDEKPRKKGFINGVISYVSAIHLFSKGLKTIKGDFDIVLSHVMSPIFTVSKVPQFCKKRNIPQMFYGLDLWPESLISSGYFSRKSLIFQIFKPYCKRIYNSCDLISFASPSVEKYIKDYMKVSKPFKHIYQPCLSSVPLLSDICNHKYKADGKLHILFCGNLARFNHIELFILALSKYALKDKIVLELVGSGVEFDNLKKLVKDNGLEKTVIFYGRVSVEETKQYYYQSDILFVPLFYNSATSLMIPQKVIEYFMYGRPIFGMIKGDGADLIEKASHGNVICDQNIDSLVSGIDRLYDKSEEELMTCGLENRTFFDSTPQFQLSYICNEINESLRKTKEQYEKRKK